MCRLSSAHALVGRDGSRLIHMLARGATIAVCEAQTHNELFAALALHIDRATGTPPNLNVYLTGPHTHGVAPHVDDHDVAALHLSGNKQWLLGEHGLHSVVLHPGHVLLVPSGLRHTTVSMGDGISIHVAINCERGLRDCPRFFQAMCSGLHAFERELTASYAYEAAAGS